MRSDACLAVISLPSTSSGMSIYKLLCPHALRAVFFAVSLYFVRERGISQTRQRCYLLTTRQMRAHAMECEYIGLCTRHTGSLQVCSAGGVFHHIEHARYGANTRYRAGAHFQPVRH